MVDEPTHPPVLSPGRLRASGALLAAHTALARRLDAEAVGPTGHDPTTLDLLVRLDQAPGNTLRAVELSRQLAMSTSHISRTLDRVEGLGLVSRGPDPGDRRAALVCLTDAGREVVVDFAPRFEAILGEVIDGVLTPDEVDALVDSLGRIEAAANG